MGTVGIYIHYILYSLVLILYLKCGGSLGGGGGGYWLNGRWFLQIVDNGRAFYHEIGNIEKCPFTYWLNGGGGFSKS